MKVLGLLFIKVVCSQCSKHRSVMARFDLRKFTLSSMRNIFKETQNKVRTLHRKEITND